MTGNALFKKISFKKYSDGRGDLIPLEFGLDPNKDIPFNVKRCYYITSPSNKNNAARGRHAHLNLKQVIICLKGKFSIDLDNGKGDKNTIELSSNDFGIYIEDLIWRELRNFSNDCVILVLASEHYSEGDYIKDYETFLNKVNSK